MHVISQKWSPKFQKFEFYYASSFPCIWKNDGKVFGKYTLTLWRLYGQFLCFLLHYDNYDCSLLKFFEVVHHIMRIGIIMADK